MDFTNDYHVFMRFLRELEVLDEEPSHFGLLIFSFHSHYNFIN